MGGGCAEALRVNPKPMRFLGGPRNDRDVLMTAYFVYIMTNRSKTLYIGVTNNLERRVFEHKGKLVPGFTSRYNLDRLVYYESTPDVRSAIEREKQIKGWRRQRKPDLIQSTNPGWRDLSRDWGQ